MQLVGLRVQCEPEMGLGFRGFWDKCFLRVLQKMLSLFNLGTGFRNLGWDLGFQGWEMEGQTSGGLRFVVSDAGILSIEVTPNKESQESTSAEVHSSNRTTGA